MSQPESIDLAADHVRQQINEELHDEVILNGTTFDAGRLDECDCIPLDVTDSRGRNWCLQSAAWVGFLSTRGRRLEARYECAGVLDENLAPQSRADYDADRADMQHSDGEG